MSIYSNNPENTLKRANDFRELGKHDEALVSLYDILKNRKNRMLKNVHESIIHKYLEICVDLKKSQAAKDGLYLYRSICQGVNIKSWEDSLCEYLQNVEEKTEHAREVSHTTLLDTEKMDLTVTPEYLLKYVSSEDAQDRTERLILLPWVRFLWESYRICLELLRNPQMEKLYHKIAQKALAFCLRYSRKSELRKLCNLLRVHIAYIHKQQAEMHFDILDTEIQVLYLETGISQLECAVQMELWQDAFKAIEDIHFFLSFTKKPLNSRIMANYYEKLSLVFWKASDYLFHAAAVLRQFLLMRELKKNLTVDEISVVATRVVLATLSIPFSANNPSVELIIETDDSTIHKKQRLLATLLDFPCRPTRSLLIKDLERLGIIQYSPITVQNLFYALEFEFLPLQLGSLIEQTNILIDDDACYHNLKQYMIPVRDIATIKLLSELSKMYKCITFTKLISLIPAIDDYYLERLIVDSARRYNFSLRVDHSNKCLHFYIDGNIFQNKNSLEYSESQQFFCDRNLNHLAVIQSSLVRITKCLASQDIKIKNQIMRSRIAKYCVLTRDADHKKVLERKKLIEKHKEAIENLRLKKEEEERKHHVETQLKYIAAEKERLLKEAEERNTQRLLLQKAEIKRKIFLEKMEMLKKTQIGCQLIENLDFDNLDTLDPEVWLTKQIELFTRERKEFLSRLRRQEKTVDYTERAKRVEEIPLLIVEYEEDKITYREIWEQDEKARVEIAHRERERDIKKREKILKVKEDLDSFILNLRKRHKNEYHKNMNAFLEILNSERQKRMKRRALCRKTQRRSAWLEIQKRMLKQTKYKESTVTIPSKNQAVLVNNSKIEIKTAEDKLQIEPKNKQLSNNEENTLSRVRDYVPKERIESDKLEKISTERKSSLHSIEEESNVRDIKIKSDNKFRHDESAVKQNAQSLYVLKRFEKLSDDVVRSRDYNDPRPEMIHFEKSKSIPTNDPSDIQHRRWRYDDRIEQIRSSSFRTSVSEVTEKQNNTRYIYKGRVKDQGGLTWRREKLESFDQPQRTASKHKVKYSEKCAFGTSDRQKPDLKFSCTPWAKSSRKEDN